MTKKNDKPIIMLEPVKQLQPAYLNEFRNTPHYQNGMVQENITLPDILKATEEMHEIFPFALKSNDTEPFMLSKGRGESKKIHFRNGLYLNPAMRVVASMDKVTLQREISPQAYRDPLSEDVIFAYRAALERLATLEQGMYRAKKPETAENRKWCLQTLENFVRDPEGLNAEVLWQLYSGEGTPTIKSKKTALQTDDNILRHVIAQLAQKNQELGEYRTGDI